MGRQRITYQERPPPAQTDSQPEARRLPSTVQPRKELRPRDQRDTCARAARRFRESCERARKNKEMRQKELRVASVI